jgi:leucyl aminopeptidase
VRAVTHNSTRQNSVALRIEGAERPNEIVVLGGHLDSVNWSYFGEKNDAPGADDNASGSAANLEALRILLAQGRPQRTIEFFWYAAEEVGLNGSNEIATEYRNQKKDVVAVLQLDMTLFPGKGVGTIGNVTDFTTGWLRDLLVEMNTHYIKARLIDDKCGYACSDHASWYQKGYSTLMPFESDTNSMNNRIHTKDDRMSPAMSLRHAAMFSKIAVSYGMIVANSTLR